MCPCPGASQQSRVPSPVPEGFKQVDTQDDQSISELMQSRIEKEQRAQGAKFKPELVKMEADYGRLSATSRTDVLYEASFHMQPQYYTGTPTGPDTLHRVNPAQPIMYYIGSARTPLALPMVSNLAKALSGDEASYTINLGILPLPCPGAPDSIHYYAVIERAIESNHTDNVVRFEHFQKEFTAKADEPVPLRLANEPLAKGLYIVRLENGQVLDFYDDFSRFIEEHIVMHSERLKWTLGKETISDISSRLSIPYSVALSCVAKIELLSVVDTGHPRVIVDTVRHPSDYLAEVDMTDYAPGPYRYRFIASELGTGRPIFSEVHTFQKTPALMMVQSQRMQPSDTITVGGKKIDWNGRLAQLNGELTMERVKNDRITQTLIESERAKRDAEAINAANGKNSIADVHGRVGVGLGTAAGDNFFVGIEANRPALSFDVSFGFLYASAPYLSGYTAPAIVSKIGSAPKSLGVQLTWIPVKFLDGLIEPLVAVGYYGIWSQPSQANALSSATLLSGQIGIACEPLGELHGLGFSLSYGAADGLGLSQGMVSDVSFKTYVRF